MGYHYARVLPPRRAHSPLSVGNIWYVTDDADVGLHLRQHFERMALEPVQPIPQRQSLVHQRIGRSMETSGSVGNVPGRVKSPSTWAQTSKTAQARFSPFVKERQTIYLQETRVVKYYAARFRCSTQRC